MVLFSFDFVFWVSKNNVFFIIFKILCVFNLKNLCGNRIGKKD